MSIFSEVIMVLLVFVVNPLISFYNAKSIGGIWNYSQNFTIWDKVLCVSGLLQSIIGFSMPIIGILLGTCYYFHLLSNALLTLSLDLFWVTIIIPFVGTSIVITIQSIKNAIETRSIIDGGIAIWNISATIENIVDLFSNFGSCISGITSLVDGDSSDDSGAALGLVGLLIGIGIVLTALFSGLILTCMSFNYGKNRALTPV